MARRGRPPVLQRMERIDLRIPPSLYDVLCQEAVRLDLKVSVLSRRIIAKHFLSVRKSASTGSA